jgi:hypothetical protein
MSLTANLIGSRDPHALSFDLGPVLFALPDFALESWRARGAFSALLFSSRSPSRPGLGIAFFQQTYQSLGREASIGELRSRILGRDLKPGRLVTECHGGRHFVNVLATRPGRSGEELDEIFLLEPQAMKNPQQGRLEFKHIRLIVAEKVGRKSLNKWRLTLFGDRPM